MEEQKGTRTPKSVRALTGARRLFRDVTHTEARASTKADGFNATPPATVMLRATSTPTKDSLLASF